MNKKAFTLSEVLITLTILGIIAAITIPTLSAAAKKHSYAVAVRKFHSNLSNAVANYMAVHDYTTLSSSPMEQEDRDEDDNYVGQEACNQFIRDNFKVTKECDSSNREECLSSTVKSIGGDNWTPDWFTHRGAIAMLLADGSVVSMQSSGDFPIDVYIDINGKKGPNVTGYDIWAMNIYYNGTIDEKDRINGEMARRSDNCAHQNYGGTCFAKLMGNDWVIDW